jgi:preprotein translocase subunit Sec61beta
MKRNFFNLASIVFAIVALLFSLTAYHQAAAQEDKAVLAAPQVVSYQGYVTLSGSPYNGQGHFKFLVTDSNGTECYWSNDGSSTGASDEPESAVQLTVANGLFNVLLGNTNLAGMTQTVPASVFSAPNRWLRIWFSSSPGGPFTLLTPDRKIASVPFALVAETAATAADAGLLDGLDSLAFALAGHNHNAAYVNDNAMEVDNADIATGTISANRIAGTAWTGTNDGSGTGLDADLLDGFDSTYFQGQAETLPIFSIATLDSVGSVGRTTSMTIGADGLGLISYYDETNSALKVAHCSNAACTQATSIVADSTADVTYGTSIAIGADGLGWIAYYDYMNTGLQVAHCSNTACTEATHTVLDYSGNVGMYPSIAVGADGLLLASYYDLTNGNLKVLHCTNTTCSSVTTASPDTIGWVGLHSSLRIGADGLGLISYYDFDNEDLKVAHCSNTSCSTASDITPLDSTGQVGKYSSLTIGKDGLGLISYYDEGNNALKVAHCSNTACTAATITTLDTGYVGEDSSITTGPDGLGLISYYASSGGELMVAHCSNANCSAATVNILDSVGNVGSDTSITIGTDGLGLISYYDVTNTALKVVHLSNALGIPWVRPR